MAEHEIAPGDPDPASPGPASTDGAVLLDLTEGVATVTLNRPAAMNALDIATKNLLLATLVQAADDPGVRCVVLTGAGRAFCGRVSKGRSVRHWERVPEGRARDRYAAGPRAR